MKHIHLVMNIKDMNYKEFTSNEGWVSFNYPFNMNCLEEYEGTYLLYTEETGSFRITPLKLEGASNFNSDKYLDDLSVENDGEILQNSHNKYVYYIYHSEDEDNILVIYNWIFATTDKIVYCSYTVDTESINDPKVITEKEEVVKIIENLTIK